jgi:hypothetical protein
MMCDKKLVSPWCCDGVVRCITSWLENIDMKRQTVKSVGLGLERDGLSRCMIYMKKWFFFSNCEGLKNKVCVVMSAPGLILSSSSYVKTKEVPENQ